MVTYFCLPSENFQEHVKLVNFLNKIKVEVTSVDVCGRACMKVHSPEAVELRLRDSDVYQVNTPGGMFYVRTFEEKLANGESLAEVYTSLEDAFKGVENADT